MDVKRKKNKRSLRAFEMSVLRKILGRTRRDRVLNADIMKDLALDMDIVEVLRLRRLTYFGHCTRMDPSRYPHILRCMVTLTAHDQEEDPWKRWLENVKEDCATLQLTLPDADRLAKDRSGWKSLIHRTCGVVML